MPPRQLSPSYRTFTGGAFAPSHNRSSRTNTLALMAITISALLYLSRGPFHHLLEGAQKHAAPEAGEADPGLHAHTAAPQKHARGHQGAVAQKHEQPAVSRTTAVAAVSGNENSQQQASSEEGPHDHSHDAEGVAGETHDTEAVVGEVGKSHEASDVSGRKDGAEEEHSQSERFHATDSIEALHGAEAISHASAGTEGSGPGEHEQVKASIDADPALAESKDLGSETAGGHRGGLSAGEGVASGQGAAEEAQAPKGTAAAASARSDGRASETSVLEGSFEALQGHDVVWQIPHPAKGDSTKGTVFFAHGCKHKATHFWPKSASCDECIGLPEEKLLVHEALSRGYAAIAIDSGHGCWDHSWPPEDCKDVTQVAAILKAWMKKHELGDLPLMALGSSSGGSFITLLAHAIKVEAQVVMVSDGIKAAYSAAPHGGWPYPPTLFVYMPKDEARASLVKRSMKLLRAQGVHTAKLPCKELKVADDFFSDRIGVSQKLSSWIVAALTDAGLLNLKGQLKSGYLTSWKKALDQKGLLDGLDRRTMLSIKEELNVAYAFHDISGEHAEEILDWFDGVCNRNVESTKADHLRSTRCRSYRTSQKSGT